MPEKHPKRPRDPNQLAKLIVDIATSEDKDAPAIQETEAAVLGRVGGLKGGKARAAVLSPSRRSEIAKAAAAARWKQKNDECD